MGFLLWFLFILLGIFAPKNKFTNAYQKTYMVVIWGLPYINADLESYRNHFVYESGFDFSLKNLLFNEGIYHNEVYLMKMLGGSFELNIFLIACFSVFAFDYFLNRFEVKNKGFVWTLMLLQMMANFVTTIQQRFAVAILLFAICCLRKRSAKNAMLCILLVMIAGGIHTGAYEYLLLLGFYFCMTRQREKKMLPIILIAEFLAINIIGSIMNYWIENSSNVLGGYIDYSGGWGRVISHLVLYTILLFLVLGRKNIRSSESEDFLKRLSLYLIVQLPILYINIIFRRFLEVFFFIPFCCASKKAEKYGQRYGIFYRAGMAMFAFGIYLVFHVRNYEQFERYYLMTVINGNKLVNGIDFFVSFLIACVTFFVVCLLDNTRFICVKTIYNKTIGSGEDNGNNEWKKRRKKSTEGSSYSSSI